MLMAADSAKNRYQRTQVVSKDYVYGACVSVESVLSYEGNGCVCGFTFLRKDAAEQLVAEMQCRTMAGFIR